MKWIFILLTLVGCQTDILVPTCSHDLELEGLDRVHIQIVSDLPEVTILKYSGADTVKLKVQKDYYKCISLPLFDDETVITIQAESSCEYIF